VTLLVNITHYEVDTSGPGRKAATINIGLQAGLMTTPISNKSFRDITINCNIIPASLSSMQHLANKVGSVIVKHNRDDMKEIRETIVEENGPTKSHFVHFNLSFQANPHFLDAMESNSSSPSQPFLSIACSFIVEFQRTLTREGT
jgi:hypothetical protein